MQDSNLTLYSSFLFPDKMYQRDLNPHLKGQNLVRIVSFRETWYVFKFNSDIMSENKIKRMLTLVVFSNWSPFQKIKSHTILES